MCVLLCTGYQHIQTQKLIHGPIINPKLSIPNFLSTAQLHSQITNQTSTPADQFTTLQDYNQ